MSFDVNSVKRHIQNLIAGNNISKNDFIEMYKTILEEQIKKRVERYLSDNMVKTTIEKTIHTQICLCISKHMQPIDGLWGRTNTNQFQKYVEDEVRKQVQELIKTNVKIEIVNQKDV